MESFAKKKKKTKEKKKNSRVKVRNQELLRKTGKSFVEPGI